MTSDELAQVQDDLITRLQGQPHEAPCLRGALKPRGECSCWLGRAIEFIEASKSNVGQSTPTNDKLKEIQALVDAWRSAESTPWTVLGQIDDLLRASSGETE